MPATDRKLELIKEMQQEDEIRLKLAEYSHSGWPDLKDVCTRTIGTQVILELQGRVQPVSRTVTQR